MVMWALVGKDPARVIEEFRPMLAMYHAGFRGGIAWNSIILAEAYLSARRFDDSRVLAESIGDFCNRCGQHYWQAVSHRIVAQALLSDQRAQANAEARDHLETAIRLLSACKAEPELAHACAWFGRFHQREGDRALAAEYLNRALEIYDRLEMVGPETARTRMDVAALRLSRMG